MHALRYEPTLVRRIAITSKRGALGATKESDLAFGKHSHLVAIGAESFRTQFAVGNHEVGEIPVHDVRQSWRANVKLIFIVVYATPDFVQPIRLQFFLVEYQSAILKSRAETRPQTAKNHRYVWFEVTTSHLALDSVCIGAECLQRPRRIQQIRAQIN